MLSKLLTIYLHIHISTYMRLLCIDFRELFFLQRNPYKLRVKQLFQACFLRKSKMDENIFLFVPNLIGYGRIFLALLSFWFMPTNHIAAGWCYILSGLLDAFDGHAARYMQFKSYLIWLKYMRGINGCKIF